MVTIGIDPGLTGAVFLDYGEDRDVYDMPVVSRRTGKGREVSGRLLHDILNIGCQSQAYLERVSAMPGQGVTSVFSFGRSLGVVEGVLAALDIPYTLVSPQTWKRRAGLIGRPKDEARTVALQLYPALADKLKRKKDCGRADALLIAHFGRQA